MADENSTQAVIRSPDKQSHAPPDEQLRTDVAEGLSYQDMSTKYSAAYQTVGWWVARAGFRSVRMLLKRGEYVTIHANDGSEILKIERGDD